MLEHEPVVAAALGALGKKPSVIPGGLNKVLTFVGSHLVSRKRISAIVGKTLAKALAPEMV